MKRKSTGTMKKQGFKRTGNVRRKERSRRAILRFGCGLYKVPQCINPYIYPPKSTSDCEESVKCHS